jgi:hypothetical protein
MSLDVRDAMLMASVARMIREDTLVWRAVEGLGFMRADVLDTGDQRAALHIWHPELREPAMIDSGMLHDHRFSFRSLVLVGAIHDTEIVSLTPSTDDVDPYQIHEVAEPTPGHFIVTEQVERYRLVTSRHTYRAGSCYFYAAGRFHTSEVSQLTVTLCWKSGEFGGGRLLARAGRKPVHLTDGYGLDLFTKERVARLKRAACEALVGRTVLDRPRLP